MPPRPNVTTGRTAGRARGRAVPRCPSTYDRVDDDAAEVCAGGARPDSGEGRARRGVVAQVDLDAAELRLVHDVGRDDLHDGRVTDLRTPPRPRPSLRRAETGRRQSVGTEPRHGLGLEQRPSELRPERRALALHLSDRPPRVQRPAPVSGAGARRAASVPTRRCPRPCAAALRRRARRWRSSARPAPFR